MKRTNHKQNESPASGDLSPPIDSQNAGKKTIGSRFSTVLSLITGADVIAKCFADTAKTVCSSFSRIKEHKSTLVGGNQDVPYLGECGSDSERFAAAMKHYRTDEIQLAQMIRNTKRNFDLCFGLLVLGIVLGFLSLVHYPLQSIALVPFRFLAIPILAVFVFKHAYYNWLYRTRQLAPAAQFFKSGDIWPKIKAK